MASSTPYKQNILNIQYGMYVFHLNQRLLQKEPEEKERANLGNVDNEKRTLCTTHNV